MEDLVKYYDYKNKNGDTFRILPALADKNRFKKYKIPNKDVYYPCLIRDTLKNDMKLYNSTVKIMSNSIYGSFGTGKSIFSMFGKEESPQEKRNKARTSFQKKLDKVKNH